MKRVLTILIAAGVLCLASAISGIASFSAGVSNGAANYFVAYYPSLVSRAITASYGLVCLLISFGVYRRLLFAWRAGIIALAVGWLSSVIQLWAVIPEPSFMVKVALFSLLSVVIFFITLRWGKWWYGQRSYFTNGG